MDLILLFFFKWIAIASAIGVVNVNNPVHAILLLITVFMCAGAILLILQADFLALLYVVVYVGAIAVLFLFVIMCLNVKVVEVTSTTLTYLPLSTLILALFTLEAAYFIGETFNTGHATTLGTNTFTYTIWIDLLDPLTNIEVIGQTLFLFYTIPFILVGFILLIAMLGSIVLTLSHAQGVRRQVIWLQNEASFAKAVRLIN